MSRFMQLSVKIAWENGLVMNSSDLSNIMVLTAGGALKEALGGFSQWSVKEENYFSSDLGKATMFEKEFFKHLSEEEQNNMSEEIKPYLSRVLDMYNRNPELIKGSNKYINQIGSLQGSVLEREIIFEDDIIVQGLIRSNRESFLENTIQRDRITEVHGMCTLMKGPLNERDSYKSARKRDGAQASKQKNHAMSI